MSEIQAGMTPEEIAACVCSALDRAGITVVLSGGGAVSVYSDNEYESKDLDFVRAGLAKRTDTVLERLGFHKDGRHWVHPLVDRIIDVVPGPVGVGRELVTDFAERSTPFGVLRILTPTDCVKDRLCWFYHDSDPQCLDQAVAVACRHPVDLAGIRAWSRAEGAEAGFETFARKLASRGS